MIFVTVGTTYFDELIEEVDSLLARGVIKDRVVAQIGTGRYKPQHAEWVRFLDDLRDVEKAADLVVCHGGVGSMFELAELGRPFIAVPNRQLEGDHQADLVRALEGEGWFVCCWNLRDLGERIVSRHWTRMRPYRCSTEFPRLVWQELLHRRLPTADGLAPGKRAVSPQESGATPEKLSAAR